MHSCPDCGQACYCHGDIEDHENEFEADLCVHGCEEQSDAIFDDFEMDFGSCEDSERERDQPQTSENPEKSVNKKGDNRL